MSLSNVTRRWDGTTVATVNGVEVVLSPADIAAIQSGRFSPPPVVRPLTITTGDGRVQGAEGPARFGVFWNGSKWVFLDSQGKAIPSMGGWKKVNLNRAEFHFNVG